MEPTLPNGAAVLVDRGSNHRQDGKIFVMNPDDPASAGAGRSAQEETMSKASDSGSGRLDALPDVLFIEDVAAVLRCSPSTIRRRRQAGVFTVPTLPGVDKRPQFSRVAFLSWFARHGGR